MDGTRRILLLGKTGVGKSSLANTIGKLDKKDKFMTSDSPNSVTKKCVSKNKKIKGRNIELIDTPGVFDTDPTSSNKSHELLEPFQCCVEGVHAILLVLKVERYTTLEQDVVNIILKYFSEEALNYTTIIFTHGNDLEKGKTIEEWASENEALKNLVQKCGGRCHVFDNRHWVKKQDKYRYNKTQIKALLKTIDETVEKNGGVCYRNDTMRSMNEDGFYKWAKSLPVGLILGALLGVVLLVKEGDVWKMVSVVGSGIRGLRMTWGWASERYPTPNDAVKEATSFMTEIEGMFKQMTTTSEAANEVAKSSSCTIQ